MPTTLITGANRGIGLEFARQYAAAGWRVIATCRDPARSSPLSTLGGTVEIHALDVTDPSSILSLSNELNQQPIDLLIANAGVMSAPPRSAPLDIAEDAWIADFRVNAMGSIRVAAAFAPQIAASRERKLVAISSLLGSIGSNAMGGHYAYRASKAALNALWRSFAVDHPELIAVSLSPGLLRTDMTRYEQAWDQLNDPAPRVAALREVIGRLSQSDSGTALNFNGDKMPW